jgi:hypothetical protein
MTGWSSPTPAEHWSRKPCPPKAGANHRNATPSEPCRDVGEQASRSHVVHAQTRQTSSRPWPSCCVAGWLALAARARRLAPEIPAFGLARTSVGDRSADPQCAETAQLADNRFRLSSVLRARLRFERRLDAPDSTNPRYFASAPRLPSRRISDGVSRCSSVGS